MPCMEQCKIIGKSFLNEKTVEFLLEAPQIASTAVPGQFVNVSCGHEHFLRRPISICQCKDGVLTLVIEVRGQGTKTLSEYPCGSAMDLLGPLGNGFLLKDHAEKTLLVGGGIGIAPLVGVADALEGKCGVIIGFRSSKQVILKTDFMIRSNEMILCTDDGTEGIQGNVCLPLEKLLDEGKYTTVLCCGPTPMMRAVAECCKAYGVSCQVSLEQRMGCGIGACLVCACKIRRADREEYLHVCKDGPVFDASEVLFE